MPQPTLEDSAAPPTAERRPKIPQRNPFVVPTVFCPNRGCYQVMEPVVVDSKEFFPTFTCICRHCLIKFTPSLVPANGEIKPLTVNEIKVLAEADEKLRQYRDDMVRKLGTATTPQRGVATFQEKPRAVAGDQSVTGATPIAPEKPAEPVATGGAETFRVEEEPGVE